MNIKLTYPSGIPEVAFFDENDNLVQIIGKKLGISYPKPTSDGPIHSFSFSINDLSYNQVEVLSR